MLKGIVNGFVIYPLVLLAGIMGLGLQVELLAGYLSCIAIVFVVVVVPIITQKNSSVELVSAVILAIGTTVGEDDDSEE